MEMTLEGLTVVWVVETTPKDLKKKSKKVEKKIWNKREKVTWKGLKWIWKYSSLYGCH